MRFILLVNQKLEVFFFTVPSDLLKVYVYVIKPKWSLVFLFLFIEERKKSLLTFFLFKLLGLSVRLVFFFFCWLVIFALWWEIKIVNRVFYLFFFFCVCVIYEFIFTFFPLGFRSYSHKPVIHLNSSLIHFIMNKGLVIFW